MRYLRRFFKRMRQQGGGVSNGKRSCGWVGAEEERGHRPSTAWLFRICIINERRWLTILLLVCAGFSLGLTVGNFRLHL